MQQATEKSMNHVSQLDIWLSPEKVCLRATPSPLHAMTDNDPMVPVIVMYTRGLLVPYRGEVWNMRTTARATTKKAYMMKPAKINKTLRLDMYSIQRYFKVISITRFYSWK